MAFDDETEDERPRPELPLPPDDRLWRHPSEVGGGTPLPSAWPVPPTPARPRRGMQLAALGSAALAGVVVAMAAMWVTRPTRVVIQRVQAPTTRPITTAVFTPAGVPAQRLAKEVAPSLVQVEAAHDDRWASGTGVWLDDDGTIAVATALVAGSVDIEITDVDGTRTTALPMGSDDATGITILRVSGETGSPAQATEDDAETGQPVAVIGAVSISAQGETHQRAMAASVSATGVRTTVDPLVLHDAVQLDRAVPSDALGGVVVDADGHLVGIVLAQSGDDGLAVVIPAGQALDAARSLRDDGIVRRAWLGVEVVDLTPDISKLLGVDGGAKLTSVAAGSPAEAAGFEPGDVITEVDGRTIGDASDLVVALRSWRPGDHVAITWHRGPDTTSAELTLGG